MRNIQTIALLIAFSVFISTPLLAASGSIIESYDLPWPEDSIKYKAILDDPRPYYKEIDNFKKLVPEEVLKTLRIDDIEEAKKAWAEAVGFKSPDVVGKIAPEIKPGKYTLEDKTKYPFEKLMPPTLMKMWGKPGEGDTPRHGGCFTEFTIIPTTQRYHPPGTSRDTKKYEGQTKLDNDGFLVDDSYIAGRPFPRPQEPHKGWKYVWNHKLGGINWSWEDAYSISPEVSLDKNLREDRNGMALWYLFKYRGRSNIEPIGPWYDEEAEKERQATQAWFTYEKPRSEVGNIYYIMVYSDHSKLNELIAYYAPIRRIRKFTATDGQDTYPGRDATYDDDNFFNQSLSKTVYPYEVKVIEETEILWPSITDGSYYIDSKDSYMAKNVKLERRPVAFVEMKQLDKNYIYSKRIFIIDREYLAILCSMNFDQKGRLFRAWNGFYAFLPEFGVLDSPHFWVNDYIDEHSSYEQFRFYPAPGFNRDEVSVRALMRAVK